ncbi:hypothetical protein NRE35_004259 [Salmonella enterica]|nr:hypothetical protein [Escherichia coli]EJO2543893.1 hypothetical protein [Salmonella enterica]
MPRTTRFRVHNYQGVCKLYDKESGVHVLTATPILKIQDGANYDGYILLPVTYMSKGDGNPIPIGLETFLYGVNIHHDEFIYTDRLYSLEVTYALRNIVEVKVTRSHGKRHEFGSCTFIRAIYHRVLQNGKKRFFCMNGSMISDPKWLKYHSPEFRTKIWPWYLENRTQYHRI